MESDQPWIGMWGRFKTAEEELRTSSIFKLEYIHSPKTQNPGWFITSTNVTRTADGKNLYDCAMALAGQSLHLDNCCTIRVFRGVRGFKQ